MKKHHLLMAVLLLISAIVVARVQTILTPNAGVQGSDVVSMTVPEGLSPGDEFTLSIALTNTKEDYTAFVFDVVAPEGISFVQEMNQDDEMDYVYALNADRKKSDHQLACNYLADSNTLRLACFSSTNKTFKGTSGEIATVKMKIDEEAVGDYAIRLTKVAFTDVAAIDFDLADASVTMTFEAKLPEGKQFEANKIYYLYNVGARKYYCAGNQYGTRASVGEDPLYVKFSPYESEEGVYLFNSYFRNSWMLTFIGDEYNAWVDRVQQPDYGWQLVKAGDYYRLQASASTTINPNYSSTNYPNAYLGLDVTSDPKNTALSPFLTEGDGHYIDWILIGMEGGELKDWTSANHDHSSSSSNLWIIDISETGLLRFDWSVSSEQGCDILNITLDGVALVNASGEQAGTYEDYISAGSHLLIATYSKDGSANSGTDEAVVKNIDCGTIGTIIEGYISEVEAAAEANKFLDTVIRDEAFAYIQQIRNGEYDKTKGEEVIAKLIYYKDRVSVLHLDIVVDEAGTMGDLILDKVENFSDVQSMRVSGSLNSADLSILKSGLVNIMYLDMSGTDLTAIADEQFRNNSNLISFVPPVGLVSIGRYAFYNCSKLQGFSFPSTLQTIGEYAFNNCQFEKLVIPEGVVSIGRYAFACSDSYEDIYDANGNRTRVYRCKLKSVTLPSTVTSLENDVFRYQRNLETVTFAEGLTSIGSESFYCCEALKSLNLPSTLTTIGSYAFRYCNSLRKIELPEGLTTIGSYAFYNCSNLEEVVLPSTLRTLSYSFSDCEKLTRMTCKNIVPPSTGNNDIMGGLESQCTLSVPSLSVKAYKQTPYWNRFNIVGADILPEQIVIASEYRVNWPEDLSIDYKPSVRIENTGRLEITGNSTLSAGQFTMVYDENLDYERNYGDRGTNAQAISASLVNKANARADAVIIDMWLRANVWTFFSLPFDAKVGNIGKMFDNVPFVIRKYDGQNRADSKMDETWVTMTADSTLQAGKGYIIQSPRMDNRYYNGFWFTAEQTVNKNNIFVSDNVEVELTEYQSEFPQNRSWNLIGNPYPCYYDTRAIDVTTPLTVWNARNGNYQAYSPVDDQLVLRPGEAFFIQRPVDQASITFLKEGRQMNYAVRDVNYFANARQSDMTGDRSVFNLTLTNGEQSDRTRFVINANAQLSYEMGCDASKFMSSDAAVQLYTIEQGQNYAINERPLSTGEVLLGATFAERGTYTITLSAKAENEVWLIDRLTGTEMLLSAEGYTFESEAGTFNDRFAIRLGNGDVTGIKTVGTAVESAGEYYNLKGMRVAQPTKGLYINNGKKVVVK